MFGLSIYEIAMLAVALLIAGGVTGVLAGLFGVGGGAIIVPVLYELFRIMGVTEDVRMATCVGTSLAVIIPTSIRSFRAHNARGAADLSVLKAWAAPIVVGVLMGAAIARYAPPALFKLVFVCIAAVSAVRLLGGFTWRIADDLPKGPLMALYGWIVGILSALMGIGGGQLTNLIMMFHNRPIHQTVATSSGVGMLIALPGTLGYMIAGWDKVGLPPLSLGFVSLIGVALFIPASVATAPLGVRVAHALTKRKLELAFGAFLLIVCLRFVVSLLG